MSQACPRGPTRRPDRATARAIFRDPAVYVERFLPALDDALRRLDPTWRAVVVLHFFLGMSLPEAASTLGIPLGTAKSRLHRSLGLMRLAISDEVVSPSLAKGHSA